MDLLIATGSVPLEQRDIAPTSGTPQWATDGNPATGVPATDWPAWMFNMLLAEMINVVDKAGLERSLTDWTQLYQAINKIVGPGRLINRQSFSSSANYIPASGATLARIRGCGAGGPGGYAYPNPTSGSVSAGGGGGAGAECDIWISLNGVTSVPVTIGSPAAAIASDAQNSGGDSMFGSYVTLKAGQGGAAGISTSSSGSSVTSGSKGGDYVGGLASLLLTNSILKKGAAGQIGLAVNEVAVPGFGASATFGSPGAAGGGGAVNFGAGGGGGQSLSTGGGLGGVGAGAIFYVEEYT